MSVKEIPLGQKQYNQDGFYIHPQAIIPVELIKKAVAGMDTIRTGVYQ